MHSLGMGFTVSDGVSAAVCLSGETRIELNGVRTEFPTVACVVRALTAEPLGVVLTTGLPMSSGFGLSGACALATAYAVNELLTLGESSEQLALAAHVAEVENLTGLGDVCGQFHGGCLAKLRPGHPLAADRLSVRERPIFYRYYGPIHTAEVLRDAARRERINRAGDAALAEIQALTASAQVDFDLLVELSHRFAVHSGLLSHAEVARVIREVEMRGGRASMIMLGDAVFSTVPFPGAAQTMLSARAAELM